MHAQYIYHGEHTIVTPSVGDWTGSRAGFTPAIETQMAQIVARHCST
jgi:hypothetical protein